MKKIGWIQSYSWLDSRLTNRFSFSSSSPSIALVTCEDATDFNTVFDGTWFRFIAVVLCNSWDKPLTVSLEWKKIQHTFINSVCFWKIAPATVQLTHQLHRPHHRCPLWNMDETVLVEIYTRSKHKICMFPIP